VAAMLYTANKSVIEAGEKGFMTGYEIERAHNGRMDEGAFRGNGVGASYPHM
jgi:hypothetical protein